MPEERPILWLDPMVRAVLNTKPGIYPGEPADPSKPAKWQTRRIMTKQPGDDGVVLHKPRCLASWAGPRGERIDLDCPFGELGDLLYGRECWAAHAALDDLRPIDTDGPTWYRADDSGPGPATVRLTGMGFTRAVPGVWRPSIFMPKDRARIWHEIVSVRVERLHEITEAEAKAEGMPREPSVLSSDPKERALWHTWQFELLWKEIYGAESWAANPWVWVLDLKRIDHDATGAAVGVSDG